MLSVHKCEPCEDDGDDVHAQEAIIIFDLIGAYHHRSLPVIVEQDQAYALLDCEVNVACSTLVRQRLMDVLGSADSTSGLRFTVLIGARQGAEPAVIGSAHLPLCELVAAHHQVSEWELPVLAVAAAGAPPREVGRLNVTFDGHAALAELLVSLREHGGSAYKAEAAEARKARLVSHSGATTAPELRSIRVRATELVLAGDNWWDARATPMPPPSLHDCWGRCAPPVAAAQGESAGCRLNALVIMLFSAADMWSDVLLCYSWLFGGHLIWGMLLLVFVLLGVLVTLVVTLHEEDGGYFIPAAMYVATILCAGPPLAAARAACCAGGSLGAHDLAQDMHLTEALVEGCPALLVQAYALLSIGPASAPPLLWLALSTSALSVTHAIGSDFEYDRLAGLPLGLVGAEYALAAGRISSAALPLALCANAFGVWALLLPPLAILGNLAIARLHRTALRALPREARVRRWLAVRTAQELWLALIEGVTAGLALGWRSRWLSIQPPALPQQLGLLVVFCIGIQLLAVAHVDSRVARTLRSAHSPRASGAGAHRPRANGSGRSEEGSRRSYDSDPRTRRSSSSPCGLGAAAAAAGAVSLESGQHGSGQNLRSLGALADRDDDGTELQHDLEAVRHEPARSASRPQRSRHGWQELQ